MLPVVNGFMATRFILAVYNMLTLKYWDSHVFIELITSNDEKDIYAISEACFSLLHA